MEYEVTIVRTEVTSLTVRVTADGENEAKRAVYERDCRGEFDSDFEETDECGLDTQYYVEEAKDGD